MTDSRGSLQAFGNDDASSHVAFDWFFFTSHSFRMQVFFLIAGFFGRMRYHRRGWWGFAQHRFARIAVPFLIGWLILCPLVVSIWMWAANLTGRNLVPLPIPFLLELMYAKGLVWIPRSQGGLFNLVLAIAFIVLFATYHYGVRSTVIGRWLNGQSFAFTRWPFERVKPRPAATAAVPAAATRE